MKCIENIANAIASEDAKMDAIAFMNILKHLHKRPTVYVSDGTLGLAWVAEGVGTLVMHFDGAGKMKGLLRDW